MKHLILAWLIVMTAPTALAMEPLPTQVPTPKDNPTTGSEN